MQVSDSDSERVLKYLQLPEDYQPSPSAHPLKFLSIHLRELPSELLRSFDAFVTPKQRSTLPVIRNRRLTFLGSNPDTFTLPAAKSQWHLLYPIRQRHGIRQGLEEKAWAENDFLGGGAQHVGKLGNLLREHEEDREIEKSREQRLQQSASLREAEEAVEEFEEEFDSDDEPSTSTSGKSDTAEEMQHEFLRLIRERFIYGLLEVLSHPVVPNQRAALFSSIPRMHHTRK
jgi:hypothetical protein